MLYKLLYSICFNGLIFFTSNMLYNQKAWYNLLCKICYNRLDYHSVLYDMLYTMLYRYKQDAYKLSWFPHCVTVIRPSIGLTSSKKIYFGNKKIIAIPAGLQITGETPRVFRCAFGVPFRSPPVFFNETIDRDSGHKSSGWSSPISFQFCRGWHF